MVTEWLRKGTVKFSATSNVSWSSEFPWDEASVPKTIRDVPETGRANPRTVICGNLTGTVRKSLIVVLFSNNSLKIPRGKFVRSSATELWVLLLNRYELEERPKVGEAAVATLRGAAFVRSAAE